MVFFYFEFGIMCMLFGGFEFVVQLIVFIFELVDGGFQVFDFGFVYSQIDFVVIDKVVEMFGFYVEFLCMVFGFGKQCILYLDFGMCMFKFFVVFFKFGIVCFKFGLQMGDLIGERCCFDDSCFQFVV